MAESNASVIDLALDTLRKEKQAIIFVNTKRSAEKVAEDLSTKLKELSPVAQEMSEKVLHSLQKPTVQCERLAKCVRKGIAFHHAGLVHHQRELVEEGFRSGVVKIIAATPTLAMGVDLPAFRVIMRDVKRYTHQGYTFIPVLEYHQMCGRAGRPNYDTYGEAISIASTEDEREELIDRFIKGKPEAIYSKLAVEPVLRTHLLSLIASNFVNTKKQIMDFFEQTFWAFQYKDMHRLEMIICKMLDLLEEWEFVVSNAEDFKSAGELEDTKYRATFMGKRVAELYLDPLSAFHLVTCIRKSTSRQIVPFSWLQMVSNTLEMRPLLKARTREYDQIQQVLVEYDSKLLQDEPSMFEPEYEDFLNSVKTAMFFHDWIGEKEEDYLLKTFDIRPGESRAKLDIADWLLYSAEDLARILQFQPLLKELERVRVRLKYGVKEELLPLIRFKHVGRVRARMLFRNNIRDVGDVKKADLATLTQILGKQTALSVKEQVGQELEPVKPGKRKGQIALHDYRE
jgi:helicase